MMHHGLVDNRASRQHRGGFYIAVKAFFSYLTFFYQTSTCCGRYQPFLFSHSSRFSTCPMHPKSASTWNLTGARRRVDFFLGNLGAVYTPTHLLADVDIFPHGSSFIMLSGLMLTASAVSLLLFTRWAFCRPHKLTCMLSGSRDGRLLQGLAFRKLGLTWWLTTFSHVTLREDRSALRAIKT